MQNEQGILQTFRSNPFGLMIESFRARGWRFSTSGATGFLEGDTGWTEPPPTSDSFDTNGSAIINFVWHDRI